MASKPNYNFQRAERDRAKKAKKEEKAQEKRLQATRSDTPEPSAPATDVGPASDQPGGKAPETAQ